MIHNLDKRKNQVRAVPLFPLPNVVLLPRAILPLHIFEERYKTMTAHALSGSREIAMALLKPGWEVQYYGTPPIEPVVCVGSILSSERLPDGTYNFLLQGIMRARIIREVSSKPYRVAEVAPINEQRAMEIDLSNERQRLLEMFCSGPLASTPAGLQLKQILASPLTTSDVADLIAFNFLDHVGLKQSLLAEADVRQRLSRLISALEVAVPLMEASCQSLSHFSLN